ncbi:unnamed protein product [Caenorhabditis sp. 36 PRJEB53466]|nr:unnamed protein product [Caenorhabditis sp. 36 PRJEB53466]
MGQSPSSSAADGVSGPPPTTDHSGGASPLHQQQQQSSIIPQATVTFDNIVDVLRTTITAEKLLSIDYVVLRSKFNQGEQYLSSILSMLEYLASKGVFDRNHKLVDLAMRICIDVAVALPQIHMKQFEAYVNKASSYIDGIVKARAVQYEKAIDVHMQLEAAANKTLQDEKKARDALSEEIDRLKQELEALKASTAKEIVRAKQKITRLEKENDRLEQQVTTMKTTQNLEDLSLVSKRALRDELKTTEHTVKTLKDENSTLLEALKLAGSNKIELERVVEAEKERSFRLEQQFRAVRERESTEKEKRDRVKLNEERQLTNCLSDVIGTIWLYQFRNEHEKAEKFAKMSKMLVDSRRHECVKAAKAKLNAFKAKGDAELTKKIEQEIARGEAAKREYERMFETKIESVVKKPNMPIAGCDIPTHATYLPIISPEIEDAIDKQMEEWNK